MELMPGVSVAEARDVLVSTSDIAARGYPAAISISDSDADMNVISAPGWMCCVRV
jgi:hypothetical protein